MSRKLLAWGARLHEVGIAVSYGGHHKHGAYLVAHSDMPGFSRDDQGILAALIRGHRRRLGDAALEAIPSDRRDSVERLSVLLRLAVRLNRSRNARAVSGMRLAVKGRTLGIRFPSGWLEAHPLTKADLEEEAVYLDEAGFRFEAS
jgi:exopolyphosphatase/guanosine-5'-triphosphate,3'-diphosphate pyrophosphatase